MSEPMPPSELAAMVDRLTPHITRGQWEWHNSADPDARYLIGDHGHMCIAVEPMGSDYRDADPEAIALVPDLMAENQRMRRELKALRDEFRFIHHRRRAHEHLTRILEGEN